MVTWPRILILLRKQHGAVIAVINGINVRDNRFIGVKGYLLRKQRLLLRVYDYLRTVLNREVENLQIINWIRSMRSAN
jgi:hypothetical protein